MDIDSDTAQDAIDTAKREADKTGGVVTNEVVTVAESQPAYFYPGEQGDR